MLWRKCSFGSRCWFLHQRSEQLLKEFLAKGTLKVCNTVAVSCERTKCKALHLAPLEEKKAARRAQPPTGASRRRRGCRGGRRKNRSKRCSAVPPPSGGSASSSPATENSGSVPLVLGASLGSQELKGDVGHSSRGAVPTTSGSGKLTAGERADCSIAAERVAPTIARPTMMTPVGLLWSALADSVLKCWPSS
jgi:hypothetical protein